MTTKREIISEMYRSLEQIGVNDLLAKQYLQQAISDVRNLLTEITQPNPFRQTNPYFNPRNKY